MAAAKSKIYCCYYYYYCSSQPPAKPILRQAVKAASGMVTPILLPLCESSAFLRSEVGVGKLYYLLNEHSGEIIANRGLSALSIFSR
jgi:hypothetical protein